MSMLSKFSKIGKGLGKVLLLLIMIMLLIAMIQIFLPADSIQYGNKLIEKNWIYLSLARVIIYLFLSLVLYPYFLQKNRLKASSMIDWIDKEMQERKLSEEDTAFYLQKRQNYDYKLRYYQAFAKLKPFVFVFLMSIECLFAQLPFWLQKGA